MTDDDSCGFGSGLEKLCHFVLSQNLPTNSTPQGRAQTKEQLILSSRGRDGQHKTHPPNNYIPYPSTTLHATFRMRFLAAVVLLAAQFGIGVQSFVPSMIPHQRQSSLYFSRGDEFGPAVFDINSPDDFREFVAVDDRPAVIKVYADWCKTCRLFDVRYRKVASSWGCDPNSAKETEFSNLVRFAQMEYGGENCNNCREDLRHCNSNTSAANEEMCKLLDATRVPYILIYKRDSGRLAGFACPPSKVQLLIDALHEYALPSSKELEIEQILSYGVELVQGFMPEIQKDAGYTNDELTFEEFCIVHTRQKRC